MSNYREWSVLAQASLKAENVSTIKREFLLLLKKKKKEGRTKSRSRKLL